MSPSMNGPDFVVALRGISHRYWGPTPFHHRLHNGDLNEHKLRVWAANRWYFQRMLPQKDAAIISNCPLPDIRRQWLQRITYHDGGSAGEGGIERWLRSCTAVGLGRDEVLDERHVAPGVRFAVDAYVTFARTKPWIEAIASGLTEMFAGHMMRRRVDDMLARYPWITADDLAYFTDRIDDVSGEGQATVDIVVRHCLTREQQDKAIAALSFKCDIVVDAGRHRTRGCQAMKTLGTDSVPPLRRGVRLTYDKFRQAHVLLFPEGVLVLNATATAVLELCDGIATVEVITTALRGRYSCVRDQEVADVLTRFGQRLLSNGSEAGRTSAGHAGRTDPPLPAPLPVLRESSPATTR